MTAKSTTNSDLDKKLDKVIKEVTDMNVILLRHDGKIGVLEQLEHDRELIKKNTLEVMDRIEKDRQTKVKDGIANTQLKAWHLVVGILGILSAIIYAIATTRGVKP